MPNLPRKGVPHADRHNARQEPGRARSGARPHTRLMSIVAEMMSLIIHVQASARLIEAEIQRDRGGADGIETTDVVILDDVTPCYATRLRICRTN
jgi:hypothetical protein